MKRIFFVVHGRLRRNRKWKRIWAQINFQHEWSVVIAYTAFSGHAISLVKDLLQTEKIDVLVACGGDGTLNECVNGVMQAGSNVPLGILSLGTGNDFVKTLKIRGDWEELKHSISNGFTVPCDVMCLKTSTGVRYGLNVADVGIGGEVVQRMAEDGRWLGAFLTYQKNIVKSFLLFKSKEMRLTMNNAAEVSHDVFMLAAANAAWFGSGLCIDPEAELNDGLLNVVLVKNISLFDYIRQLPFLRKGIRMRHSAVTYHQCRELNLLSSGWPIDCDGEFIGFTPMSISLAEGGIKILLPKTIP